MSKIDSDILITKLHNYFMQVSTPDYRNDNDKAWKQIGSMLAIMSCQDIIKDLANTRTEPELHPCDPILMTYTMEDFLKVVDDAKCFGLEVVIHNGKPYYRELT